MKHLLPWIFLLLAFSAPASATPDLSKGIFDSPAQFIGIIQKLKPKDEKGPLERSFFIEHPGQDGSKETFRPVWAATVESCQQLWADADCVVLFALASPDIPETKAYVGLLYVLKRTGDKWTLHDGRKFNAFGKYAGIEATVTTQAGTGYTISQKELILTVKVMDGGRGLSTESSASYRLENFFLRQIVLDGVGWQ